ncbi:MAG: protein kinase [Sandaracinaceae bacterium]|nr:protein kinase [Sandaracinaceae bacterium]
MGKTVGERYSLNEPLGDGPLGEAWRGEARGGEGFTRAVVVVDLATELATSNGFVDTLMVQGGALAERPHPHLEGILDVVREGDHAYLVVEATDGPTLKAWVEAFHARGEPAPWGQLLSIAVDVLYALHGLHGRPKPLAHGGVDTRSVRLDRSGVPVLTRFGVAPACEAGGIEAERLYVRTAHHAVATPMADVFAMGLLLYTVLAGSSDTALLPDDLRARLDAGKPVDLKLIRDDIPPVVLGLVDRAFQSDPSRRFDSALAMARALELVLHTRPEILDAPALAKQIEELVPKQRARPKLGLRSAETDQLDLAELQRLSIPDE